MTAASPIQILTAAAEKRALQCIVGEGDLQAAVDGLQYYAERAGPLAELGQDRVQDIMAAAFIWAREFVETDGEDEPGDLVTNWELADPRDAWRHTGETPPPTSVRNSDLSGPRVDGPSPQRIPQATIDAFNLVAGRGNRAGLAMWLRDHPDVARELARETA